MSILLPAMDRTILPERSTSTISPGSEMLIIVLPFERRLAWYNRRFAPFGACHCQTVFPALSTSITFAIASMQIRVVPASVRWLLRIRMFADVGALVLPDNLLIRRDLDHSAKLRVADQRIAVR